MPVALIVGNRQTVLPKWLASQAFAQFNRIHAQPLPIAHEQLGSYQISRSQVAPIRHLQLETPRIDPQTGHHSVFGPRRARMQRCYKGR